MGFSLLRVTVNRQRHKAAGQSDDESCVCARWVAATRLFILFLFFFPLLCAPLRNVLEHVCAKVSWCIVWDLYDNGILFIVHIFYILFFLNKTRPITIFNSNYSFSWLAHAKVLSIRWMSLSISRERWREINLEQFKDESNLERITRILVADFFPCWFKYHDFFHRVIEEKFYRFPRPKFSS